MTESRTFRAHARHVDACQARTLVEPSFAAAAVVHVEDLHELPGVGEAASVIVIVIVQEIETGHEHCFRIDQESGETSLCG